jgi:sugar lactone lactonase YvrE
MREWRSEVVLADRGFLEGPRWHEGELWLSDLHRHEVLAFDPTTAGVRVMAELDDQPSGLGFLPGGDFVVTSLTRRAVLRGATPPVGGAPSELAEYADLAAFTRGATNDMIVDPHGRAYVGSFGYDWFAGEPKAPGNLVLVGPHGSARVVADGLHFPNGMAITPAGELLVAETDASRITAFAIGADGSLSAPRLWCELDGAPDGMCLDPHGALWVALSHAPYVVRVEEGGRVTDRVEVGEKHTAVACALGGPDGQTLFVCAAKIRRVTTAVLEAVALG